MLGGLIEDRLTKSHAKVPFLGDIPLLGALFRNSSERIEKRNLMVFIKPTILDEDDVAEEKTRDYYDQMRTKQQQSGSDRKGNNRPVLQELNTDS